MLREELQLLQEQGSYVGEVVKPMDKKKVLVKVFLFFPLSLMNIRSISSNHFISGRLPFHDYLAQSKKIYIKREITFCHGAKIGH